MKKIFFLLFLFIILISGCKKFNNINWLVKDYNEIEKAAYSTKVKFFMWGGDAKINNWIDTYVAAELKKQFKIDLIRVPADASIFINKLLGEKEANKDPGTMDILWINGENFKNAMENNLLYGPFTEKLPNFNKYINKNSVEYDFGYPVKSYEAPYGKAQFVFEYDEAKIKNPPDTFEKLFQWVKNNPGRFTYPQPPDFTGSAFIRQAFYAVTGGYEQYIGGYNEKLFFEKVDNLINYLNDMKPYLWEKGINYPKDISSLDTLFERGEVDFNMSYHQAHAQSMIIDKRYKDTVKTFVMKEGSIYNTHFTAIPYNAPNKAGAIVVANFLLSPEAQLSKNDPKNWGDFTVLDINKLPEEFKKKFEGLDLGNATLPLKTLYEYAVPEIPSLYLERLEDEWEKRVLKN